VCNRVTDKCETGYRGRKCINIKLKTIAFVFWVEGPGSQVAAASIKIKIQTNKKQQKCKRQKGGVCVKNLLGSLF
jgi:hypothetical protein